MLSRSERGVLADTKNQQFWFGPRDERVRTAYHVWCLSEGIPFVHVDVRPYGTATVGIELPPGRVLTLRERVSLAAVLESPRFRDPLGQDNDPVIGESRAYVSGIDATQGVDVADLLVHVLTRQSEPARIGPAEALLLFQEIVWPSYVADPLIVETVTIPEVEAVRVRAGVMWDSLAGAWRVRVPDNRSGPDLLLLYCHELGHVTMGHVPKLEEFDAGLWQDQKKWMSEGVVCPYRPADPERHTRREHLANEFAINECRYWRKVWLLMASLGLPLEGAPAILAAKSLV